MSPTVLCGCQVIVNIHNKVRISISGGIRECFICSRVQGEILLVVQYRHTLHTLNLYWTPLCTLNLCWMLLHTLNPHCTSLCTLNLCCTSFHVLELCSLFMHTLNLHNPIYMKGATTRTTKLSQMLYRLPCTVLNLSGSTKCYYANCWLMWSNVVTNRL